MIEIPLTKGQYAVIDDEDADLAQFKWHCVDGYAVRNGKRYGIRSDNKRTPIIKMHRVILARMLHRELLPTEEVDHIHGNRCDNRRSEIRLSDKSQNQRNAKRRSDNTSGYKGVDWSKQRSKWRARIYVNGKSHHIGFYDTPEQAHKAYCQEAEKYFGEFARFE